METNVVVRIFEGVAKFFYALMPAVLPYSTPLPIAMITANSAETFFGMDPWVAGVFVFSLEGLGVWSTTTFIDKVVEWVRSRNSKVAFTAVLMFFVVATYLTILVLLNVVLKGDQSSAYKAAVTLVCFLPFVAGVLNGFHKVNLRDKDKEDLTHNEQVALQREEAARQERLRIEELRSQERIARAQSRGQSTTPTPTSQSTKTNWTDLTQKQKTEMLGMSLSAIMQRYGVSKGTAHNWKLWARDGK